MSTEMDMDLLPEFVRKHQLATLGKVKDGEYINEAIPVERIEEAEVITSLEVTEFYGGATLNMHRPVLDIDFPAALIPSSTEGHFHLLLDKKLSWGQYIRLLNALADAGILEEGYVNASINREFSSVRLPWVKKRQEIEPL